MQIKFQCNQDDYSEAQRAHFSRNWGYYVPLFLACLSLFVSALIVLSGSIAQALPAFALALGWSFIHIRLFHGGFAKRDFQKHPHLAKEYSFDIDTEGIRIASDVSNEYNKWPLYTKFRETKNLFMLYKGDRLFEMIPKRAFAPEEIVDFRNILLIKFPQNSASSGQ